MAKISVSVTSGAETHKVELENGSLNDVIEAARAMGLEVGKVFKSNGEVLEPGDELQDGDEVRATPKSGAGA